MRNGLERVQQGACVPLVPKPIFAEYINECARVRFGAAELNAALRESSALKCDLQRLFAPTGAAMAGLARTLGRSSEKARSAVVDALFRRVNEEDNLMAHFSLENVVTV